MGTALSPEQAGARGRALGGMPVHGSKDASMQQSVAESQRSTFNGLPSLPSGSFEQTISL